MKVRIIPNPPICTKGRLCCFLSFGLSVMPRLIAKELSRGNINTDKKAEIENNKNAVKVFINMNK
tara:strand:+ start:190 stop:384 length:195 start_codon:yes stop_codon:yes gene_type:complete